MIIRAIMPAVLAMIILPAPPANAGAWSGEAITDGYVVRAKGEGHLDPAGVPTGSWQSHTQMGATDTVPDDNDTVYAETKYWSLAPKTGGICMDLRYSAAYSVGVEYCTETGGYSGKLVTPYTCAPFCPITHERYTSTAYVGGMALDGYGLRVRAVVCVDRSFPHPNSCSQPYSEVHSRVPGDPLDVWP